MHDSAQLVRLVVHLRQYQWYHYPKFYLGYCTRLNKVLLVLLMLWVWGTEINAIGMKQILLVPVQHQY